MKTIQEFLRRNHNTRKSIACVGDVMVDEYHKVRVHRISPEFPMPIMLSPDLDSTRRPGGVGNVAYQLKHFNIDTQLVCFIDNEIKQVLEDHQINYRVESYSPAIFLHKGHVPLKRRFLDGDVQVVRWDIEEDNYGLHLGKKKEGGLFDFQRSVQEYMLKKISPDVVIFSDYNKGFFYGDTNWPGFFKDSITIVDPKSAPIKKWHGCNIFKPNKQEAYDLTGTKDWKDQCMKFMHDLNCEAVVITQGGQGVVGRWGNEFFQFRPDDDITVISVVGAGDCFVSGLAMAVAHGFKGEEAAAIAYEMGAQYVQHGLNRPITPAEMSRTGIVEPEDLADRDYKLVFTNGCFDILHSGHLQTLEFAATKGDKLVVALNDDESIRRLKGEGRPVKNLEERMRLMASLKPVDFVVSFGEDTPQQVIEKIRPDVLVKGAQYELTNIVGADIVPEVYRAPMVDGMSTTALIDR